MTSLSVELSAERKVAEEMRSEVLAAEAEACKYQAEVRTCVRRSIYWLAHRGCLHVAKQNSVKKISCLV